MSIFCAIFGHKLPRGYYGPPYLRLWGGACDGINREHWHVAADCARCGRSYTVAMLHGPLPTRAVLAKSEQSGEEHVVAMRGAKLVERTFADLEANGTRRCLLCSAINPCATHSWSEQRDELARNDAESAALRSHAQKDTQ